MAVRGPIWYVECRSNSFRAVGRMKTGQMGVIYNYALSTCTNKNSSPDLLSRTWSSAHDSGLVI